MLGDPYTDDEEIAAAADAVAGKSAKLEALIAYLQNLGTVRIGTLGTVMMDIDLFRGWHTAVLLLLVHRSLGVDLEQETQKRIVRRCIATCRWRTAATAAQ